MVSNGLTIQDIEKRQKRRRILKGVGIGLGAIAGAGALAGLAYYGHKNRATVLNRITKVKKTLGNKIFEFGDKIEDKFLPGYSTSRTGSTKESFYRAGLRAGNSVKNVGRTLKGRPRIGFYYF